MSMRAARVRNLLLLIAIFATIVAAGCWDDRRTLQRVLDDGYSTVVEITGAQNQRLAPFAFDGWRPRFVEQGLSVNLKWNGKDGKPHTFEKVPVTDDFAHTIIEGDQVRLAPVDASVAVKALSRLEPGFDLLDRESAEAIAAVTTRGAWRLTLARDPAAAIEVLVDRLGSAALPAVAAPV